MKHIGIISEGEFETVLSFVNCSTGKIDKQIDLTGFMNYDTLKKVYDYELVGEPHVVYDHCRPQRYQVGELVDVRYSIFYADPKGISLIDYEIFADEGWDNAILLKCRNVGSHQEPHWINEGEYFTCNEWELTVQRGEKSYHYEWCPEEDEFYNRMKEEFGLEFTFDFCKENGINKVVEQLAEKLNLNIINIINL